MKRLATYIMLVLACAGGVAAWTYRAQLFGRRMVSPLCSHYEDADGVEADFVRRMRIADTLRIDVTRLHATDSVAWQQLVTDFNVPPETDAERCAMDGGVAVTRLTPYPATLPADSTLPPPVVAVSPLKHTVTVFHVKDNRERHAIVYYNLDRAVGKGR